MTTKKRFLAVEEYIIIILFSSMIIILASQVFTRYILSFTLPWAEQLTRVMFVWITFAGISLAVSKRMHLRVTAITMIIPERWHAKVYLVGDVIAAAFGFFMSYRIYISMMDIVARGQNFPVIWGMPTWVMYLPGVIGMLGFGLRMVFTNIIPALRNWNKEIPDSESLKKNEIDHF